MPGLCPGRLGKEIKANDLTFKIKKVVGKTAIISFEGERGPIQIKEVRNK